MKKLFCMLLSIALILVSVPCVSATTAETGDEPIRILAIGNSYSNNATQYIDRIAENLGLSVEVYSLYYPGCTLEQHVNFYNNQNEVYCLATNGVDYDWSVRTMQQAFEKFDYDYVTLQQAPGVGPDKFSTYWTEEEPWLTELYDIVKENEPQAEIKIHQTWSPCEDCVVNHKHENSGYYENTAEMFKQIAFCYTMAAEKLGLTSKDIIPAGKAIQLAKDDFGFGDFYNIAAEGETLTDAQHCENGALYTDDICHLNNRGRYIASLVWTEYFFGVDCRETTYVPEEITEQECVILREIAHEAATGEQTTVQGDWRVLDNGDGVRVMHYMGEVDATGTVSIPASFNGKATNAIAACVFKNVSGIKKVIIPDTELTVEEGALDIDIVEKSSVQSLSFDTATPNSEGGNYFIAWWATYQYQSSINERTTNWLVEPNVSGYRSKTTVFVHDTGTDYANFSSNFDHTGNGGNSIRIKEKYSSSSGSFSNTFIKVSRLFGDDKIYFDKADLGKTFEISFWMYFEKSSSGSSKWVQYGLVPIASRAGDDAHGYSFYNPSNTNVNVGEWTNIKFTVTLDEKHIGADQIGLLGIYLSGGASTDNGNDASVYYLDDVSVNEVTVSKATTETADTGANTYSVTYKNGENVVGDVVTGLTDNATYIINRIVENTEDEYFAGWYFDKELTREARSSFKVTNSATLYAKMLPYAKTLTVQAEENPTAETYFTGFAAGKHRLYQGTTNYNMVGAYGVYNGKYGDLITNGQSHRHRSFGGYGATKVNGNEVRDLTKGTTWASYLSGDYIIRDADGNAFVVKPDTTYKVTLTYTFEATTNTSENPTSRVFLGTGFSASKLMYSGEMPLYDLGEGAVTKAADYGYSDTATLTFNTETEEQYLTLTSEDATIELSITTPSLQTYKDGNLLQVLSLSDAINTGTKTTWKKIVIEEVLYDVTYVNGTEEIGKASDIKPDTVYSIDRVVDNTNEEYFAGWYLDKELTTEAKTSFTVNSDVTLYAKMLSYNDNLIIESDVEATSDNYYSGFASVRHTLRETSNGTQRGVLGAYGLYGGKYGDLLNEGYSHRHPGFEKSGSTKVNGSEVRDLSEGAVWQWYPNGDYILRNADGTAFIVKPDTTYKVTLTYTNERTSLIAESTTAKAQVFLATGLSAEKLIYSENMKLYDLGEGLYSSVSEFSGVGVSDVVNLTFNTETEKVLLNDTAEVSTVELTITTPSLETYKEGNLLQVLSLSDSTNRGFITTWKTVVVEEIKNDIQDVYGYSAVCVADVEDNQSYKVSFNYIAENDVQIGFFTADSDSATSIGFVEGENKAVFTAKATNGETQNATAYITVDKKGGKENAIGNTLYLYVIGDGDGVYITDAVASKLTNASGNSLISNKGVSILKGLSEDASQAMRYYFSYDTVRGDDIVIDGKTYTVKSRGFLFANGNIMQEELISRTTANGSSVIDYNVTDFTKCWKTVENNDALSSENLWFSVYARGFDSVNGSYNNTDKLYVKGYVVVEIEGTEYTFYGQESNTTVSAVAALTP